MKKKTIGQESLDLSKKAPTSNDPIEIQREAHKEYEQSIEEALMRGKKEYDDDFFVVVLTKKERLLENVLRNYFFVRSSCPTPEWDQTVYQYHAKDNALEFLWVIPSKDTCSLFLRNRALIAPEERHLLEFIIKDRNGELLALSKKLNNEKKDSPIIEG